MPRTEGFFMLRRPPTKPLLLALALGLALGPVADPAVAAARHKPRKPAAGRATKTGKNLAVPVKPVKGSVVAVPILKPAAPKGPNRPVSYLIQATPAPVGVETIELPAGKADDNITLATRINLPGGSERLFLRARGLPVQEVIGTIAEMKNLNLIIDPSVTGTVAVDFQNIPLNQIMETLLATNALTMQKTGSTYIIYRSGRYGQAQIRFVPVHFAPASTMITKITTIVGNSGISGASNTTGGASGASSFSPAYKLIADSRTNSIIVHGTNEDIEIVERLVKRMDVLMPSKIFRLTYLTPVEAINLLKNSYFVGAGVVQDTVVTGGGAGAGAGAGAAGAAGGSGGAGGGGALFTVQDLDFGRGSRPTQVNPGVTEATPRFVPLVRDNNLLVIGSREELNLVEQILPRIDKRRRQVLLRTQIVELNENGQRELAGILNNLQLPGMPMTTTAFRALQQGNAPGGETSVNTTVVPNNFGLDYVFRRLEQESKAKLLASPTILAMDNRTSKLSSTQQVLAGVTVQTTGVGQQAQVTQTVQTANVGIDLEITPRILLDNSVSLFVKPSISFPGETLNVANQVITLTTQRSYQSDEIRVKDGETIVIAGLIQESDATSTQDNLPFDLPLVTNLLEVTRTKALARGAWDFIFGTGNKTRNKRKSEVQIYITPEIQPDV
ncbi:MAG: secretin and TonB N-terminal domain-containing protein [Candidatus Sericytochromatia bacterium]|nr:secretin and TonB N-terminal domain-containing protein [Candidatus Tanganyikabacteria bacterium]